MYSKKKNSSSKKFRGNSSYIPAMKKTRSSSQSSESSTSSASSSRSLRPCQIFEVGPECELRFEVEIKNGSVELVLKSGLAEVFGSELVSHEKYEFKSDESVAVYTWQGCTIELCGNVVSPYISSTTPMSLYANCHGAMEYMREKAEKSDNGRGPVTMIVGPRCVGKSTLCRILLNYAVRMGRKPLYVDLDVSQGYIGVPGAVGALSIEKPSSITDGFDQTAPLAFNYGYDTPKCNVSFYNFVISHLAKICLARFNIKKKSRTSGMIINTSAWNNTDGLDYIMNAAKEFQVDAIIVLGHDKLHHELNSKISDHCSVISLPKSNGVISHDEKQLHVFKDRKFREYFYGRKIALHPSSLQIKFNSIKIYKTDMTNLIPVNFSDSLIHHVLSLSLAKSSDEVLKKNVAGFVCITHVDVRRNILTLLCPQPKLPPNPIFLLTNFQYLDS